MNIFELKLWDDERQLCTFYTVQLDGADENETDKFFIRYENDPEYSLAVQELISFIILSIGERHGAVDELFNRNENEVIGLPVKGKVRLGEFTIHFPDFPLRIYALKITERIVVLFNGGIKDGPTNQTSSLHLKWIEACNFAIRILEALHSNEILVDERHRKLTNHLGGDEIIL